MDKDKGEKEKEPEENDEEKTLVIPLEIYSMVEVHDPPIYGVIRWIGNLPEVGETIAGLELVRQQGWDACGTMGGSH